MALDKFSNKSDQLGNLYRAAFYLAKGSNNVALNFIKKSAKKFNNLKIATEKQRLISAERILDEYLRLKHLS